MALFRRKKGGEPKEGFQVVGHVDLEVVSKMLVKRRASSDASAGDDAAVQKAALVLKSKSKIKPTPLELRVGFGRITDSLIESMPALHEVDAERAKNDPDYVGEMKDLNKPIAQERMARLFTGLDYVPGVIDFPVHTLVPGERVSVGRVPTDDVATFLQEHKDIHVDINPSMQDGTTLKIRYCGPGSDEEKVGYSTVMGLAREQLDFWVMRKKSNTQNLCAKLRSSAPSSAHFFRMADESGEDYTSRMSTLHKGPAVQYPLKIGGEYVRFIPGIPPAAYKALFGEQGKEIYVPMIEVKAVKPTRSSKK